MRKEAVSILFISCLVFTANISMDIIFNLVTGFIFFGVIPGTKLVIPSLIMFTLVVLALSAMIVRSLRRYLPDSRPVAIDLLKLKSSV